MSDTHQFYAWLVAREWGEPDRPVRCGPYSIEADSANDAEDILYDNLARADEIVDRIEYIGVA